MKLNRTPPWMINLSQAEAIEMFSTHYNIAITEFIDRVLAFRFPGESIGPVRRKFVEQVDWLLSGRPVEYSPYYADYIDFWADPFGKAIGHVDITADEFISAAIPAYLVSEGLVENPHAQHRICPINQRSEHS